MKEHDNIIPETSNKNLTLSSNLTESSTDKDITKRDRTDKENDIDFYGNREGRHNKLKKLAQPK